MAGALALSIKASGEVEYVITDELRRQPELLNELLDILMVTLKRKMIRRVG